MSPRLALCGCLVLVLRLPLMAAQPAPTSAGLTPPQFAVRLEEIAARVEAIDAVGAARVAASIPESQRVVAGPDTYDVRYDWLRRTLRGAAANTSAWPARRDEAAVRLRAMAREVREAADAAGPPAAARQALNAILGQREFQRARTGTWQASLQRRIREWFADLWERTIGRRIGQRVIAQAVAWTVGIGAVLVLLVWLARAASRQRAERPVTMGPMEAVRAPGHILAMQAAALVRAGNIRDAARVAYRAGVRRLEEEGAFRADETRTPREYLGLLPSEHRRRRTLSALTGIFERIWYGSRDPAPGEGDAILALLEDLECLSFDRAR